MWPSHSIHLLYPWRGQRDFLKNRKEMNEWTKAKKSSSGRLLGAIIYPSSIHSSFLPSFHPSIQPDIYPSLHPANQSSIFSSADSIIHPSSHAPIYPSCHPFIYLFSYLCNTYLLSSYYMTSNVLGSGRTVCGTVRKPQLLRLNSLYTV